MFFAAMIIGLGESAQRAEHKKTIRAIYLDNDPNIPDETLLNEIADSPNHRRGK